MKTPTWLQTLVSPLARRLKAMPADQMVTWLDAAGTEMSLAFTEYARTQDPALLAEFDRGVATLVAMSQEMHRRRAV